MTEALGADGDAFGWVRAVKLVRVYRSDSAARIVANLYHAVRAFSQHLPQLDDITAVVVKILTDDSQLSVEQPGWLNRPGRR